MNQIKFFLKPHILSYFISFLIFSPLILLNQFYLDDNYRSINGYYAWSGDYRPLADVIYYIIGGSQYFLDIFPLNYILEFFFVANFLMYFSKKLQIDFLLETKQQSYIIIVLSVVFLNPLFFQNLYFRYDSLTMLVSVILVFITLLKLTKAKEFLILLAVLLIYQPTIWCYTLIVCLKLVYFFIIKSRPRKIYYFLFEKIGIFASAITIFLIYVKMLAIPNSYASHHLDLVKNIKQFKENIIESFSNYIFYTDILGYVVTFFLVLVCFVYLLKISYYSKVNMPIVGLIIVVFFVNIFSINVLLEIPHLYPRVYVSFGTLAFFTIFTNLLFFSKFENFNNYQKYTIIFLIIVPFFTFLKMYYVLYNLQIEKNKNENFAFSQIIQEVEQFHKKEIFFYGDIPTTKKYDVLVKNYPVLAKVAESNFNVNKHHILNFLVSNYIKNVVIVSFDFNTKNQKYSEAMQDIKNRKPIKDNHIYKLYSNDERLIFFFKKQDCYNEKNRLQ